MKHLITLITLFLISFQAFTQTYTGNKKHIDQILENTATFSSYIINKELDKIVASYTEDGKIFPNRNEIIQGPEGLRKYWEQPEDVKTLAHKVTSSEIKIIGKEAYDYGYYEGKTRLADGEEVSWKGKYVIVWKRVGKEWKMYLDIWNSL